MKICHTLSGTIDASDPDVEDIKLQDIAHGLSMICRYGGMCPQFYPVADHAILVAQIVIRETNNAVWALHALHHDSAEAYLGDQRGPLKRNLGWALDGPRPDFLSFGAVEARFDEAIRAALNLGHFPVEATQVIRFADRVALNLEMSYFFKETPHSIIPQHVAGWRPVRKDPGWFAHRFVEVHENLRIRIAREVSK
jgi:hypothetical protein